MSRPLTGGDMLPVVHYLCDAPADPVGASHFRCQPRRLSQNHSCVKIQGMGEFLSISSTLSEWLMSRRDRAVRHMMSEASLCDPRAGPSSSCRK